MLAKRIFDFLVACVLLVAFSPVMLAVAIVVLCKMGWPVIFKQVRPGLLGKLFTLYKFRTMKNDRDAEGKLLPDEQRLTRVGSFIRSASLDELPQLFNVLRGDMSLVGPRPLLVEYLERYSPVQARRHEVRPGITGWAQVNGRNALSWEDKFDLDVWYVDNHNLLLDLKILVVTLRELFRRTGINAQGHATMPVFEGKADERTDN